MQAVSSTYQSMIKDKLVRKEIKVNIDGVDYGEEYINSMTTSCALFADSKPGVGGTVVGRIDLNLRNPGEIGRMALMLPYYRLVIPETGQTSEWVQKGKYYIDTRETYEYSTNIKITGYDSMLMTERVYAQDGEQDEWPKTDIECVMEIAAAMQLSGLDPRTTALITYGYEIPFPGYGESAYTMREVLSQIGAAYGGNWRVSDTGLLQFVPLKGYNQSPVVDIKESFKSLRVDADYPKYTNAVVAVKEEKDDNGETVQVVYEPSGGSDEGTEMEIGCPFGSQDMADRVFAQIKNYVYHPFAAGGAHLDPAVELGDWITVKGKNYCLESQDLNFTPLMTSNIEARGGGDLDHEYKYDADGTRKLRRLLSDSQAEIDEDIAIYGSITATRLRTTRRIQLYLARNTSDDLYSDLYEQHRYLMAGVVKFNGSTPLTEQAVDPVIKKKMYWMKDISGASLGADGLPYINGQRVYTTFKYTDWPVIVYQYDEHAKHYLGFGNSYPWVPIEIWGEGYADGASPDSGKGFIQKKDGSFDIWYVTPKGELHGMFNKDDYTDLYGLRRTTVLDMSGWDNGLLIETVDGPVTITRYVEFDAENRPIKITDQDGHETVITW